MTPVCEAAPDPENHESGLPPASGPAGEAPGRILLLEDDLELAMHYRDLLEEAGWEVYHEDHPDGAKETLQQTRVDVVVCDLIIRGSDGMPLPCGGLTLMNFIQLRLEYPVRVLAITGTSPDLQLLAYAESFRIDGSLRKPVDPDRLVSEVGRLIELGPDTKRRRPTL